IKSKDARGAADPLKVAEADLGKACELLEPIASKSDATVSDLLDLGNAYFNLALVHRDLGRPAEALDDLGKAAPVHERAGNGPEGAHPLWRDLATRYEILSGLKDFAEAARTAERLPALRPEEPGSYTTAARALAYCAFPTVLG